MVLCRACRPRRHISRRTCVQQAIPPDTEEVGVFVYRNQRHCRDCGIMCLYMRFTPFTLNHCYCCKGKHIFRKTQRFHVVFSKTMQIPFKIGMKRNSHPITIQREMTSMTCSVRKISWIYWKKHAEPLR